MTSPTTAASSTPTTTTPATPAAANEKPAIIASRQHCEADGVGLSHYILIDRAAVPADAAPGATA